jgi:hypothetical protein
MKISNFFRGFGDRVKYTEFTAVVSVMGPVDAVVQSEFNTPPSSASVCLDLDDERSLRIKLTVQELDQLGRRFVAAAEPVLKLLTERAETVAEGRHDGRR